MKYIPILFTGEMVRAVLDDRKWVTRRVCKDQGEGLEFRWVDDNLTFPEFWKGKKADNYTGWVVKYPNNPLWLPRSCPYGKPGDRLWVRETWATHPTLNKIPPRLLDTAMIYYRADNHNESHFTWRPSIFMPRWASRLTLEVTGVRVERVQRISREDCFAEGIGRWTEIVEESSFGAITPEDEFKYLWDSIYKKRGYPWDANPWVWVVEFKRVEGSQ